MALSHSLPSRAPRSGQRGASIIELMVGVLIGMIVVAVVYNVLVMAEGYKRSTIGVADAQVTGQLAQFVVGREVANGGAALMTGVDELSRCTDWRLKALPVAITAGANANTSDELLVFYSSSPRVVHPVWFQNLANPTPAPFYVNSPNGFKVGDWVIATDRALDCVLARVTDIKQNDDSVYPPAGVGGAIKVSYTPAIAAGTQLDSNWRLFNMGPQLLRSRYTVDPAKAQLSAQNVNWLDPGFPLPVVPLAQNVVLMKAQYGVRLPSPPPPAVKPDNVIDCWTPADNADACGNGVDYSGPTDVTVTGAVAGGPFLTNADTERLRSIKAVRIAIVVRSEHQERADLAAENKLSASLVGQTAWLFNCAANDATCQGRIQIDNTVLNDYSRYRIYETVIPLRNALWSNPP